MHGTVKASCAVLVLLFLSIAPVATARAAETIAAHVVGVHDGDTVTVLTPEQEQLKIRLAEIDAPELDQPFGMSAKKMLSAMIFRKDVFVVKIDIDRYGRTVGRIYQGKADVNLEMVKAGGAWAYRKYLTDKAFIDAENAAKTAKSGLWALQKDQRIAPWEWRKQKRNGAK